MASTNPLDERDRRVKKSELAILYLDKINAWLSIEKNKSHRNYHPFSLAQKALSGDSINLTMRTLEKMQEILELKFNRPVIDSIDLTADDDDDEVEERPYKDCFIKTEDDPYLDHHDKVEANVSPPIVTSTIPSAAGSSHQLVDSLRLLAVNNQQILDLDREPPALIAQKVTLPALPPIEDLLESPPSASENVNPNPIVKKKALVRRNSVYDPSAPKPNVPSIAKYKIRTQALVAPSVYAKPSNLDGATRQIITVPYKKEPRAPEPAYDPKLESIRLAGFKETLYAKNFLQFDAAKKEEMQKEFLEKKAAEERAAKVAEIETESDDEAPPVAKKQRRLTVSAKAEGLKNLKRQRRNTLVPVSSKKAAARSRSREKPKKIPTRTRSASRTKVSSRSRSREVRMVNRIESEDEDEVPDHVYDNIEQEMSILMDGLNSAVTNFALNKQVQKCDENENTLSTLSFLAEKKKFQDELSESVATTSSAQSTSEAQSKRLSKARMSRSNSAAEAKKAKITSSSSDYYEAVLPTIRRNFSSARLMRSKSFTQVSKAKMFSYSSSGDDADDDVTPTKIAPQILSPLDRTTDDQTDDRLVVLDKAKSIKKMPPNKMSVPIKMFQNVAKRGKRKKRGNGRQKTTNIVTQKVTTQFQAADFEAPENVANDSDPLDADEESLLVEVPGKEKKVVRRETLVPKKMPKRRNAIDEKILEIKIEPE